MAFESQEVVDLTGCSGIVDSIVDLVEVCSGWQIGSRLDPMVLTDLVAVRFAITKEADCAEEQVAGYQCCCFGCLSMQAID